MARFLWVQKQDVGPQLRFGQAMAFDAARGRVVLFGGSTGSSFLGDTWEWDGAHWTEVADTGPDARSGHAMAFDAARGRIVLFGGISEGAFLNDTWEWDGTDWTQVADTGPSSRAGHAMAFDSGRGVTVLFGGNGSAGLLSDTWEWNGTDWAQTEDVGPPARQGHTMAFDPGAARTLLFGGAGTNGAGLGDTWSWNGTSWTQLQDIGPGACVGGAIVFASSAAILFGGVNTIDTTVPVASHHLNNNTWQLQGERWTQVQDMGPEPRWRHSMAFNTQDAHIVLFGGLSLFAPDGDPSLATGLLGDTWEHDAGVALALVEVFKAGTGSGTVISSPAGINCGGSCAASFPRGTVVTLTAIPAAGSTFTGWSGGGCTGTGSCTVTVDVATTVAANFTL